MRETHMETNESELPDSANEIETPSWTNFYNNLLYDERPIFYCCHVSNDPIKKTKRKTKKTEKKGSDKYVYIAFSNFNKIFSPISNSESTNYFWESYQYFYC